MSDFETAVYDSPIGFIEICAGNNKIYSLHFLNTRSQVAKNKVQESKVLSQCFKELDEYFAKKRKVFEVAIELVGTDFEKRVWQELRKIPFACTISYKNLALKLGDINKSRAVGRANGRNNIPLIIPCHRVIGEDGSLTGFTGGVERKAWLLKHEGALNEQLEIFSQIREWNTPRR